MRAAQTLIALAIIVLGFFTVKYEGLPNGDFLMIITLALIYQQLVYLKEE